MPSEAMVENMQQAERKAPQKIEEAPVWYQGDSPYGSFVRYVAGLSAQFHWVGIYFLKGQELRLGPYLGDSTEHTRIQIGQGVCGTAVQENKNQNVPDVRKIQNYLSCNLKVRSELVVLIKNPQSEEVLAVLDIDSHFENAFVPAIEKKILQSAKELERIVAWTKDSLGPDLT